MRLPLEQQSLIFKQGFFAGPRWPYYGKRGYPGVDLPLQSGIRSRVQRALHRHRFPFTTSILVKWGGLGDFVQMTPVAKALKLIDPERPVVAVVKRPFSMLFEDHPYIDLAVEYGAVNFKQVVKSLIGLTDNIFDLRYVSRAYGSWPVGQYFYDHSGHYYAFPASTRRVEDLHMHVCEIMLHSLGLEWFAGCDDVLVQPDRIPARITGDYVVVCGSPNTYVGGLKRWPADQWDRLIRWMRSKGILPVQLGSSTNELLHPRVVDLRGKTTPRQAAAYLQESRGYVGIEGGLFHLAKAVGAPAVVIFNATPAVAYAYPDTRVVTKRLCRPCVWNGLFSRTRCPYGYKFCINNPGWEEVSLAVAKMLK